MAEIFTLRRLYQLHIRLDDVKPVIWRRVLIDSKTSLSELHHALQAVMGWYDSHMHEFFMRGRRYGIPDDDFPDPAYSEHLFRLDDLLKQEKESLIYMYDFGDGWAHTITLEEIRPWHTAYSKPVCIDGERACPPEDCGGPPGYAELVNTLENSSHPERDSTIEWLGDHFEPERFSLSYVNRDLADTL